MDSSIPSVLKLPADVSWGESDDVVRHGDKWRRNKLARDFVSLSRVHITSSFFSTI
jgi:hypothetical protein